MFLLDVSENLESFDSVIDEITDNNNNHFYLVSTYPPISAVLSILYV